MNRKQLITQNLTEEKNVNTVVTATLKKDVKAISKAKRDVEDEIEKLNESVKNATTLEALEWLFTRALNLSNKAMHSGHFQKLRELDILLKTKLEYARK